MTRFQTAQVISVLMSAALVLLTSLSAALVAQV
jgi:hypothetical protein